MAGGNSKRAIMFALCANFSISIAKGVAAYFTKSGAMLAETVHSLADTGNQVLLLLGMKQAKKPASAEYPLGHGKAIYFWSFMVAILLFTVGGAYSLYEGIHKLNHPEPIQQWWWAVGVLTFAIIAEGVSMRAALQEVNKSRGKRSIAKWFKQSREAELVVIFGEDFAALVGLVLALIAVVLTVITGNPLWDALGTLCIGVLLIVIAFFVAIEVKDLLIGQSIAPKEREKLDAFLTQQADIESVLNVITLQLGADAMVAVKAKMNPALSANDMIAAINNIEQAMKKEFPYVKWSFFEPDVTD